MANRRFNQFPNTLHNKLVILDCNFVVDPTNVNGKGVSGLVGPGIANVFMRTSAAFTGTTASGSAAVTGISSTANLVVGMPLSGSGIQAGSKIASITSATAIVMTLTASASATVSISYRAVGSPNPASGLIFVNLQDNYNRYFFGTSQSLSPLSGVSITVSTGSALTVGNAYTITGLGTTSLENWITIGVPRGIVPAVGVTFIAAATSGTGTGTVQASLDSGVDKIELLGNPNPTLTSNAATVLGVSSGAYLLFQALSTNVVAATGTTTSGQATVTGIASTAEMRPGQSISGAGIPLGATIVSVDSATAITISANATASATVPISVGPASTLTAPVAGSTINMSFFLSNTKIQNQGE